MIAISISEEQILRNYFLSDNWNSLPYSNKYLFICTDETFEIISRLSRENRLPFQHEIININSSSSISKFSKILIGFLRNFSKSPSTYKRIYEDREKGAIKLTMFVSRLTCHKLAFIVPSLIHLIRKLLRRSSEQSFYTEYLIDRKIDCVVSLCITNTNDIFFLLSAKSLGIYTIATTRSWDNLTSHGALMVEPDIFISHSLFMNKQIQDFQKLSQKCILINSKVPWYNTKYSESIYSKEDIENIKNKNILYACTGAGLFPNELDYIVSLEEKLRNYGFNLTILQHPKSIHEISNKSSHLIIKVFPYVDSNLNSTLTEYYKFLNSFNIIIGSGSTTLLDALFLNKLILGYFPNNDKYWSSISRYVDHMYHYKVFLSKLNISYFEEEDELLLFLNSLDINNSKLDQDASYFLGSNFYQEFNLKQFL